MARLYSTNNVQSKGVRGTSEVEASKVDERQLNQQVFQREQEYKKSDEFTHNNSQRWAKGSNFGEEATHIDQGLGKANDLTQEVPLRDENERKTNEAEPSHI